LRLPFVEAVIFCSASNNRLKLPDSLGQKVFVRDQGTPPKVGIIGAVTRPRSGDTQFAIDAPMARAIGRALDQAGIRPANRSRRVSDYTLENIIYEHPQGTFQDWLGKHATLKGDVAMVRIYPRAHGQTGEQQAFAARTAEQLSDQAGAAYLAPEAFRDHEADGDAQDIFSLGSMAYFLFSRTTTCGHSAGDGPARNRTAWPATVRRFGRRIEGPVRSRAPEHRTCRHRPHGKRARLPPADRRR